MPFQSSVRLLNKRISSGLALRLVSLRPFTAFQSFSIPRYRSAVSEKKSFSVTHSITMERKLKQTTLGGAFQSNTNTTPKPRKRTTQSSQNLEDDEGNKRFKKTKLPSTKKTQKRRAPAKSKNSQNHEQLGSVPENFEFKIESDVTETPKFARRPTILMEESDNGSTDTESIVSSNADAPSEETGDNVSVSIRRIGDDLKVPNARKGKKGVSQGKAASKGNEDLAKSYLQFDALEAASWVAGQSVPYKVLSDTFLKIEQTTKRLEITRILTETFRSILATTPQDLLPAVYLCVNQVGPSHEGLELGIGDAILIKAIANVSGGGDITRIKKQYEAEGDLGSVAKSCKDRQIVLIGFDSLTIQEVFKKFLSIAKESGDKSQDRKRNSIERLLNASKGEETKFITRSLQGKLRIGLAEMTVLQAIGHAFFLHYYPFESEMTLMTQLEKVVESVKQAYSTCPSYEKLIGCLLESGVTNLEKVISFTPGIPVRPMLAKPTNGIVEVFQKFEGIPFTCEFKYDGERLQIHIDEQKTVKIYTRNAENVTGKYPDIVHRMPQHLKPDVESVVLDGEGVAFDLEKQKIEPFQKLSTRARKDVTLGNIKVHVCVFCFDCLYLNGKSLLDRPLTERREALYKTVETEPGLIQFAEHHTSTNVEELQEFLDLAVQKSTEGLIVKTLDCTYEPSKRSVNWLKLKKDYLDGLGDSFDLVVIGAWHGKGKRKGVFGSYLLAVYDPVNDEFQTICKIGTGFSEEDLEKYSQDIRQIQIPQPLPNYNYGEGLVPDVWVAPKVVWEIKAADMSLSPIHKAACGIMDETKGISIRFPRLIRLREDKEPHNATTSEQIAQMFKDQTSHAEGS